MNCIECGKQARPLGALCYDCLNKVFEDLIKYFNKGAK